MPISCRHKVLHGRQFCVTDCPAAVPCGVFEYARVEKPGDVPAYDPRSWAELHAPPTRTDDLAWPVPDEPAIARARAELKAQGLEGKVRAKTGLVLDPYFSGTKVKWLLDEIDGARAKAAAGELCFGTIDTWLVFKMTNGASHVTDVSNASRTTAYHTFSRYWKSTGISVGPPKHGP